MDAPTREQQETTEERIEQELKQLEAEICQQVAQQVTGIPVTMTSEDGGPEYVQYLSNLSAEEQELIIRAINAQTDPLVRLAIAEAYQAINPSHYGCGCCERRITKEFLALTDRLGIRELVREKGEIAGARNTFRILSETYSAAHEALAKVGGEAFADRIQKKRQELAEAKAHTKALEQAAEKSAREEALAKVLGDQVVSDDLREFTEELMQAQRRGIKKVVVLNPDVAVFLMSRSEWGGSGGIAYFDQVIPYYHGQSQLQEWQWRDRYDAGRDRHDLCVNDLGEVQLDEENGKARITVELVNTKYRNRRAEFTFEPPTKKTPRTPKLDEAKLAAFTQEVKVAIDGLMEQKNRLYACKPPMYSESRDQTPYRKPTIKQKIVSARSGLGVFIIEEQIDHRIDDPQMRYELYVMAPGQEPRMVYEDHSYDKAEGSAVIAILRILDDAIVLNTRRGQETVPIN
ncbi:MAG: hypothetical protein WC516_01100 [Patescibacteria group bacterium]